MKHEYYFLFNSDNIQLAMIVFPQPTDPVIIYPLLTPFPYVQIYLYKARLLTN
jgi:hypothetical protein